VVVKLWRKLISDEAKLSIKTFSSCSVCFFFLVAAGTIVAMTRIFSSLHPRRRPKGWD
jgi:hypothetical protein